MRTLQVELGERSYPILIANGLLDNRDNFAPSITGRQVLIVTSAAVSNLYLEPLVRTLADYEPDTLILPDGEQHKNLETLAKIFDCLLENKHNRTTTLVALGGGVVGDMTGFAAASYQRGVNFIQVPTTLLAQVDSSVGGKTAVNHPRGKNMIGAFYQPRCVIADTATLSTLPDRELKAGLAEVIKYGLISDRSFFLWLEGKMEALLAWEAGALGYAIEVSCSCKAQVVSQDETERGLRAILNLGHTFGHAIEAVHGYGEWLHGEAIAVGMLMAADLSCRLGWLAREDVQRIEALLVKAGLPVRAPAGMTSADFVNLMAVDKKVADGVLRLVLLSDIGCATVTAEFDPEALKQTLELFVS